MKHALAVILLLSAPTFAEQIKNPVSSVVRDSLAGRAKNTIAAIEEMPADKFSYKPTPEQMDQLQHGPRGGRARARATHVRASERVEMEEYDYVGEPPRRQRADFEKPEETGTAGRSFPRFAESARFLTRP